MGDINLVTTCAFHGQEYLFRLNVFNSNLEILVTDKFSGEEWQCSYDATYIENITQKTGNFKQFEIFVAMIKSGLLKTSESVSLDLLTFEDLEMLRSRKLPKHVAACSNNKRYLIVTYVVEFDKIRYPLPLEYCGPPDPLILQATIKRLEGELAKTKEELASKNYNNDTRKIYYLQKRVDELLDENNQLRDELYRLSKLSEKKSKPTIMSLQKAVSNLERSVVSERNSHHELVQKLRNDKMELIKQLEKVRCSERSLKTKLSKVMGTGDHSSKMSTEAKKLSSDSLHLMYKRSKSPIVVDSEFQTENLLSIKPQTVRKGRGRAKIRMASHSSSASSTNKYLDTEIGLQNGSRHCTPNVSPTPSRQINVSKIKCGSGNSSKASSRNSSQCRSRKKFDYRKLEEKIENLQRLLTDNLMHNK